MRIYLPQAVVSPLTLLRRECMLPAPGEILVQQGERVDPVQVIGCARVRGEFRIVDIAQALGTTVRKSRRYLQVEVGQQIKKGQILAKRGGLFGVGARVCQSPIDGEVTGSGSGRLLIEAPISEIEVRAGYYGIATRVYANRGIDIQIAGALIQGAWGNSKQGFGVLRVTVKSRDNALRARAVDTSSRGVILVGGSGLDEQALERAIELQARGIIVGGIDPELVAAVKELPFPVVATEGIGSFPMSAHIFELLLTHDGREAVLDGRFLSGQEILRPEIIIPLPAEPGVDSTHSVTEPLKVGDRVRAMRLPHTGVTGRVLDLPAAAVRTVTGARLSVAKVQPDDEGDPLLIPVVNLEALP